MKFIKKLKHGLKEFERWKKQEDQSLQILYKSKNSDKAWNHLKSKPKKDKEPGIVNYSKRDLRKSLNSEQGYLCCYCQKRVGDTIGDHDFEHLIPKSKDVKKYTFEYTNLSISCKPESSRTTKRILHDLTCNAAKKTKTLGIIPTMPMVESYFKYTEDGQIFGSNAAKDVINILNLNSPHLIRLRKKIIEGTIFEDIDNTRLLNKRELKNKKMKIALKKGGKYEEFRQVRLHIIEKYLNN